LRKVLADKTTLDGQGYFVTSRYDKISFIPLLYASPKVIRLAVMQHLRFPSPTRTWAPGSRALLLGPWALSVDVLDSSGISFVGGNAISIHAPISS
jgi:hypothetical protein